MNNHINASNLKVGDKGMICGLDTGNLERVKKLMALGILPGMDFHVIQKYPTWVFQVGNTQVALDDYCASCIRVTLNE